MPRADDVPTAHRGAFRAHLSTETRRTESAGKGTGIPVDVARNTCLNTGRRCGFHPSRLDALDAGNVAVRWHE